MSTVTGDTNTELQAMTGDAGFRHYFRVETSGGQSLIAVDSPQDKCNNVAFIAIQQGFERQGILVPKVVAVDESQGFFCLSDLGNTLLSDKLNKSNMTAYYQQAIDIIAHVSESSVEDSYSLPAFDQEFVQMELSLFNDWLLEKYLQVTLSESDKSELQKCFNFIIRDVLQQPQNVMHRDFHSRNIMITPSNKLAVIDFQDAVIGPATYDLVSLLRDCYVKWPNEDITPLVNYFVEQYHSRHPSNTFPIDTWNQWFDLTGLQRHIKVAGIFARLYLRDGKSGYLSDIPMTLGYIKEVSANYSQLSFLHKLVTDVVTPALEKKIK